MKQKIVFALIILLVITILNSCKTKRRGMVPCPHAKIEINNIIVESTLKKIKLNL